MGLLKKITRPFKKAVQKIVPKEIAGIMQVAAPFTGPAAPFVYAAGALKQRGTLGPRDLLAAATLGLPYAGTVGQGKGILGSRFAYGNLGRFGQAGVDFKTARDLLGLRDATGIRGQAERFLFGRPGVEGGSVFDTEGRFEGTFRGVEPTQGILGAGGDFKLTEGKLLSKMDAEGNIKLSPTKIGAAVTAGLSLSQTQQQIEEEGEDAGLSSSEIARLQAEAAEMWEDFDTTAFRPNVAQGGLMRTNYALGSMPTEQESGLGGLPIEADMRYTGGFMPYGAKEKADDVPARLSKNEFVFTADAVRGAGGGDINTGAKRMYQSMKQLEQMGKRA
tara:strand:- start:163 stop:1161 length:999 start_codon:yes stop_codon:yes gene_type:complete